MYLALKRVVMILSRSTLYRQSSTRKDPTYPVISTSAPPASSENSLLAAYSSEISEGDTNPPINLYLSSSGFRAKRTSVSSSLKTAISTV